MGLIRLASLINSGDGSREPGRAQAVQDIVIVRRNVFFLYRLISFDIGSTAISECSGITVSAGCFI
jgi:hypothetical protein